MADYWFKPKRYGYGAVPVTWQGWLVTIVSLSIMMGLTVVLIVQPQSAGHQPEPAMVALWAVLLGVILSASMRIARAKTKGEWKLHWGQRDE